VANAILVLTVCAWAAVIAFIVFAVVVWKMVDALRRLTDSCHRWVEIYFPPHINELAEKPDAQSGATRVTINKGWDDDETPRD